MADNKNYGGTQIGKTSTSSQVGKTSAATQVGRSSSATQVGRSSSSTQTGKTSTATQTNRTSTAKDTKSSSVYRSYTPPQTNKTYEPRVYNVSNQQPKVVQPPKDEVFTINKGLVFAVLVIVAIVLALVVILGNKGGKENRYTKGLAFTQLDDGNYSVSAGKASTKETIRIPATYNDASVVAIESYGFRNCNKLTSITIPNSVTKIGRSAFEDCTSLTSITIPDSVTYIGDFAFEDCTSLTNITLPNSVTKIGRSAFEGCTSLTSITIPDSITCINDSAFRGCTSLTSITIPDSVTFISHSAFEGCKSLTSITIPDSVTSISDNAFLNCDSLINITVGENNTAYKSIDGNLYSKSGKSLILYAPGKTDTEFAIPDNVTNIDSYAFTYCNSLINITVGENNTAYKSIDGNLYSKSGKSLIQYATGKTDTEFAIPDGVDYICSYAFSGCKSLKSVIIPDSVTNISFNAFWHFDSLTDIYFAGSEEEWNSLFYIPDNADVEGVNIHFNYVP